MFAAVAHFCTDHCHNAYLLKKWANSVGSCVVSDVFCCSFNVPDHRVIYQMPLMPCEFTEHQRIVTPCNTHWAHARHWLFVQVLLCHVNARQRHQVDPTVLCTGPLQTCLVYIWFVYIVWRISALSWSSDILWGTVRVTAFLKLCVDVPSHCFRVIAGHDTCWPKNMACCLCHPRKLAVPHDCTCCGTSGQPRPGGQCGYWLQNLLCHILFSAYDCKLGSSRFLPLSKSNSATS